MYIKEVKIKNFKSVDSFEMVFEKSTGLHVIIGNNGSGKTSVLQAIAICIIGRGDLAALRIPIFDYVANGKEEAHIDITFSDGTKTSQIIKGLNGSGQGNYLPSIGNSFSDLFLGKGTWFNTSFGPFRQFSKGDTELEAAFQSVPTAAAHLTLFHSNISFSKNLSWLKDLQMKKLENDEKAEILLAQILDLINCQGFLPNGFQITKISSDGVFFSREKESPVEINQMSDGFSSILSMVFELLRQLYQHFGNETSKSKPLNSFPGVVMIDEIDAHLHPSWQTQIGNILTSIFPNIQFIVTTHSPLICRACENGTIWRLAAPGSNSPSGEVTGVERDRLIWGNILDAYGTELFGQSAVRSTQSNEKLEELGKLNMLAALGKIKPAEEKKRRKLQKIFTTDDPTGF